MRTPLGRYARQFSPNGLSPCTNGGQMQPSLITQPIPLLIPAHGRSADGVTLVSHAPVAKTGATSRGRCSRAVANNALDSRFLLRGSPHRGSTCRHAAKLRAFERQILLITPHPHADGKRSAPLVCKRVVADCGSTASLSDAPTTKRVTAPGLFATVAAHDT